VAKKALDAGGMIGINGNMTFKRSVAIQDACAAIPMDRILAETDCPYLAPVPKRGRRNEPSFVAYTVAKIAALHQIAAEEAARMTEANARRFFRLPPPVSGE